MTKLTPEIIEEAVGYAGWKWDDNTLTGRSFFQLPETEREIDLGVSPRWVESDNPVGLAALASALISKVDAMSNASFTSYEECAVVFGEGFWEQIDGPIRDENSIIACVEFFEEQDL